MEPKNNILRYEAAQHSSHLVHLIFVDRLLKMVHIIPTVESLDALGFARHFRD
jgi:hypothetical protein